MSDFQARLRHLDEVTALLYPASAGPGRGAYAVVPSRLAPRRLVPRSRWLPGRRRLPRGPGTIEGHLGEVFGRPVRVVTYVRPARRANRKPVLAVFGPDGERLAFVKVGHTERVRALVRHESTTLAMLAAAPPRTVVAPSVLYHGLWRDMDVLALSPLPVTRGRVRPALLARAAEEIARLPAGAAFSWHGDFAPWNMAASADGRLLVWDWERFGTGVPLGFDALHHFFQRALRRMPPRVAAEACVAQAPRTLESFAVAASPARRTAVHYLATLATRYETDGHQPLGPPSQWLTPVADAQEALW
ncbi:hypothetical protein GCM10009677_22940 [Sphaerisporangium rubeum]|uniref:Aminoglycoside phosphotransferase domain-containing protein n=1 Tax=Sphaerisporangium rubeum TaxID=321317 RepID=A0A7X0M9E1_9ACTN|nr:phosphotransferase [Sphaerisporangium rubeum]MBB6476372.1 hypothetical protein [Sphaerisporangium rubeum]